jgi:tetratricopeptide (TPR) repeat protein
METLSSAKVSKTTLDSLESKGLIFKQNEFYQFSSYALFASLGSGLSSGDLKAEVGLLLQLLEGDMMMGFGMNPKVLERLEQASYQSEGLEEHSIPNRTKSLYQGAIESTKYFEAYRLALLTGNFLRMAKDIEGSGVFFEESAQLFYDNEKVPYAIALYRKSIEAYQHVKNERKRKDISQRVAMIYLQIAEKYEKQDQVALARTNYYHATILFDKADDINSAQETAKKAIKTYPSNEKLNKVFFDNLIQVRESLDVETPPEA